MKFGLEGKEFFGACTSTERMENSRISSGRLIESRPTKKKKMEESGVESPLSSTVLCRHAHWPGSAPCEALP